MLTDLHGEHNPTADTQRVHMNMAVVMAKALPHDTDNTLLRQAIKPHTHTHQFRAGIASPAADRAELLVISMSVSPGIVSQGFTKTHESVAPIRDEGLHRKWAGGILAEHENRPDFVRLIDRGM